MPDDSYGKFECPHCAEIFEWEEPQISHEYEEIVRTPTRIKAGAIGFVVVVFFMIIAIGAIGQIGQVNTDTWLVRQGEITEISYEGRRNVEANPYHAVELKVEYEIGERTTTLECSFERGAMAYVENNPVGNIIDIRQNPVDGAVSSFLRPDGGCPPIHYPMEKLLVALFALA